MAVSQQVTPLPVTNDSEEVRPSRNPVGLQVSKPDPLASNPVRHTNKPFQSLTPNSTTPQGTEDTESFLHDEREHQAAIQQRVSKLETRMMNFDHSMKGLKEMMKELKEVVRVRVVKGDREVSNLKSKVAALEKEISKNWETFKSNLHDLVKKLRPGDITIEADCIDSDLIQWFKVVHDHVRTYETCIPEMEEASREKLQALLGEFMVQLKSMQLWDKKNGFQTDCIVSQVLFFLTANQVYRIGGDCDICPLCGVKKKYRQNNEDEGDPNSHIFPESLLETYRQVHCEGIGNFIWDMALSDKYGAGKLTVRLLCHKCESAASHAEGKLRDLYVCILSQPNNRIEVPNEREWLSFVFANIMFRGLVINVNLMNEIRNGQFGSMRSLLTLRKYCMEPESVKPPPLYLSVLPNGPFRPELRDTTYIFDLQLRNPEFASVVDESFLYTKFDCFHCTLPFGDDTLDFDNVLDSKTIPSEEERKSLFPQVLLRKNLKKALQLAEYIISQSPNAKLDHHCKAFIERKPGICPQDSESIDWHMKSVQESSSEHTYQFKGYNKDELKVLVEKAAQASPLKAVVGQDILQKQIAELQECRRNLQSKFDNQKQELKKTRDDFHNCEKELKKVKDEKKVEERLRRAAELEGENLKEKHAQQEQEYHGLKTELERRGRIIEQLEEDKQELERQLNLVTPAQVEQEAEESMHNGLVTHEFIPEEPSTND